MTTTQAILKGMYLDVCYRLLVHIRIGLTPKDHDWVQKSLFSAINKRGYEAVQRSLIWNSYRVLICVDELRVGRNWVFNLCELTWIFDGKYDKPSHF